MIEGEIVGLEEAFNEWTKEGIFLVTVQFKERPSLALGKCKIVQPQ